MASKDSKVFGFFFATALLVFAQFRLKDLFMVAPEGSVTRTIILLVMFVTFLVYGAYLIKE